MNWGPQPGDPEPERQSSSAHSAYDEFANDEPIGQGVAAVWKWMRVSGEGDPDAIRRIERTAGDIREAPVSAHIVRNGNTGWVDRAWAASVAEPTYTSRGEMLVPGDDFAGMHLPEGIIVEPYDDCTLSVTYWPPEQVRALRAEQEEQIRQGRSALAKPMSWGSFGYPEADDRHS